MPGQARIGDRALGIDAHRCKMCPHVVTGPATQGANDVIINGQPGVRQGDGGVHSLCCGSDKWTAQGGSQTVVINGKPAFRLSDGTDHCGGQGMLVQASGNVVVGDAQAGGLVKSAKNHAPIVCNCKK